MKELLKNRNFRLLWIGQSISSMGDWITIITLLILVYKISHSSIAISILLAIRLLPQIIIAPWAGALIDRIDKKRLMILCDFLRAIIVIFLALTKDMIWVYILSGLTSISTIFFNPSLRASIPNYVAKNNLMQANSSLSVSNKLAMVLGPTLSGLIIAWKGISFAFYFDSITFFASIFTLLLIKSPKAIKEEKSNKFIKDISSGISFIKSSYDIMGVISISALAFFGIGSLYVLEIVYATNILSLNPAQYGFIVASAGVGVLIGSLYLTYFGPKLNERKTFAFGIFLFGLSLFIFAFSRNFYAAVVILFCEGLGEAFFTITGQTILQKKTPFNYLGRIFSINQMVCHITTLLAILIAGYLAQFLGSGTVLKTGGILITIGGLTSYLWFAKTRKSGSRLFNSSMK